MPLLHLAILALVQGITEFLPISSSGHLVLVPIFMEIPDQGLVLDVAVCLQLLLLSEVPVDDAFADAIQYLS